MRKKGALLLLLLCLMFAVQVVNADDIYERTAHSLFTGGWRYEVGNDGRHWTAYWINAPASVTAYIKVKNNPTEGVTDVTRAEVVSKHLAGPYDSHSHSYHTPSYLMKLLGLPEF